MLLRLLPFLSAPLSVLTTFPRQVTGSVPLTFSSASVVFVCLLYSRIPSVFLLLILRLVVFVYNSLSKLRLCMLFFGTILLFNIFIVSSGFTLRTTLMSALRHTPNIRHPSCFTTEPTVTGIEILTTN